MNVNFNSLLSAALPKLAVAGLLAVAASVATTYTLRYDIQRLSDDVQDVREEVQQMRRDLYAPVSKPNGH